MTATPIVPVIGNQVIIGLGDGGTPTEVFAHNAMINTTRGINFKVETESDELIDTSDQSALAQMSRRGRVVDSTIDGAGMVEKSQLKFWVDLCVSGAPKNMKITWGNMIITGPYIITSMKITADRVKTSDFQVTLEQAGKITVTTNP